MIAVQYISVADERLTLPSGEIVCGMIGPQMLIVTGYSDDAPEPELEPVRQKVMHLLETLKRWNLRYEIEPQIMITERGGEFNAYLPGVAQGGCSWEKATSIVIRQLAAMSTIAQGLKLLSEQYPEYVSVSGREGTMKNDKPCYGCERRHIGCHAECESYKKIKAERDAANAERRKGDPAGALLSAGYIKRAKRARRHDFKHDRRFRGT